VVPQHHSAPQQFADELHDAPAFRQQCSWLSEFSRAHTATPQHAFPALHDAPMDKHVHVPRVHIKSVSQ
jgi:hypothetical protein